MPAYSVLILNADRLYADFIRQRVLTVHPSANCTIVQRVAQARDVFHDQKIDLFVTGVEAPDGDIIDFLSRGSRLSSRPNATLVVTRQVGARFLATLRSVSPCGVFNVLADGLENFLCALREIASGRSYWSAGLQHARGKLKEVQQRLALLTPTENLIFALMGDGSDDASVSATLRMRLSSVRAVRKSLHAKLGIQRKGKLVSAAVQYGFVGVTNSGIKPIGLGVLLKEYQVRSKRPKALSPELAAKYPAAAEAAAQRRQLFGRTKL
jgi:DNA-binding NarL/FixJ family response regulator